MKVGELFVMYGLDWSQYNKDEATAQRRVKKLGGTLSDLLNGAFSFTLGIGVFQALETGFQAVKDTIFGFNSQMQTAKIGFETMLGSAEAAEVFLQQLSDFAAKTPFEFLGLQDAAKRLLAYGWAAKDVLPTMKALGDTAAGLGMSKEGLDRLIMAIGQMKAKGKVSAEEMLQLTEAGVPAWQILADAIGTTVPELQDMVSKGVVPADKAITVLLQGMEKRFPDMMKKMENSWEGVTSTIKDVFRLTLGAMGSNLFKNIYEWLQGVRDMASGFYEAFQAGGLSYALEQTFGSDVAAAAKFLAYL